MPTVWSNALVGVALAKPADYPWATWVVVAASCSLLYVAGMIHNDLADAAVDAVERPGRPIPSGRVGRSAAAMAAAATAIVGIHLLWLASGYAVILAVALVMLIVTYNLLHRVGVWTVLLMASCRAMIYVIGAAAVAWPLDWRRVGLFAAALGIYVVAISLIARAEADDRRRVRIVVAMICAISLVDAVFLLVLRQPLAASVAVACGALAGLMQRRILGT